MRSSAARLPTFGLYLTACAADPGRTGMLEYGAIRALMKGAVRAWQKIISWQGS